LRNLALPEPFRYLLDATSGQLWTLLNFTELFLKTRCPFLNFPPSLPPPPNRATFYLHYRDKQDLLIRTGEAIFDSLAAEAGPIDRENLTVQKPPQQLVVIFQHLAKHRDFYRVVLGKSGVPAFVARMREYLAVFTRPRIAVLHTLYPAAVPVLDDMFISEYVAGALLGIIVWWLDNDLPHSAEYVADRFGWLSIAGIYRMIGIEPPSLDTE